MDNKELIEKCRLTDEEFAGLQHEYLKRIGRETHAYGYFPLKGEQRDELLKTEQLTKAIPIIRADERGVWVDEPDQRGDYWISPFIEGKYIGPRIISVIDYQRPDRGLEVQYYSPSDSIPVKTFCKEYYPKAKWMFIPEPDWQSLKEGK